MVSNNACESIGFGWRLPGFSRADPSGVGDLNTSSFRLFALGLGEDMMGLETCSQEGTFLRLCQWHLSFITSSLRN
jgi:hypothetical protein